MYHSKDADFCQTIVVVLRWEVGSIERALIQWKLNVQPQHWKRMTLLVFVFLGRPALLTVQKVHTYCTYCTVYMSE